MPTIMTHAVVPLAIGLALGRPTISRRLLLAGCIAAIAPDFDVLAFKLGIAYAESFGHRGASHSLMFAVLLGALACMVASALHTSRRLAFAFVAMAAASHPLLDMFTNGGLGVALFWPWSEQRLFAPWQVIEVSPIGLRRFLTERGLAVVLSELRWVWLPALVAGVALWRIRLARTSAN